MRTEREDEMKDMNNGGKDAYRNYQRDESKGYKKTRGTIILGTRI